MSLKRGSTAASHSLNPTFLMPMSRGAMIGLAFGKRVMPPRISW